MSIVLWSVSASQWMMTTCGMSCVTPYVVEEHSGVSKTGCRHMGLLRIGIGTEMKRYERLPLRGVRHMRLPIRNKGTASWVPLDSTAAMMEGACRYAVGTYGVFADC